MNKPTDSVRIVIFDNQNPDKFLVITEIDDVDNFKLPGGKFESETETADEASAREIWEELGIEPGQVKLKQKAELLNDDGVSKRYIYSASVNNSEINPSAEIAELKWVTKDTVPAGKNHSHILAAVNAVS